MAQAVTYAKLTAPNGESVYVFSAWVQMIRSPISGEGAIPANACVILSGERQFVRETPEQVLDLLYHWGM